MVKSTAYSFLILCKPRVVLLMLITAWVGMLMASPHMIPFATFFYGTLGIGLASCSAAIINHLVDRTVDKQMLRTMNRPLATGELSPRQAGIFAAVLSMLAFVILYNFINLTTLILTFSALIGYAFFYTLYLKHATPQNITIGGLSGAMPPLLGWSCVSGNIHPHSLLLVLIIFLWTPPHFWALAIYRIKDYTKARIPMLPVTHGIRFTKLSSLLYTLLLVPCSLLPVAVGMSGYLYLVCALILGLIFLYYSVALMVVNKAHEAKLAIHTFNYSIVYLFGIFIALLADHYWLANLG
jgi:protoheme IX farnesyltransferase